MIGAPAAERQLASLGLAVLLLRPDRTIASVNPATEQLLGRSAPRLVGRDLFAALTLPDPRLTAHFEDPDTPISAHGIEIVPEGGGAPRIVTLTLAPVFATPGWRMLTLHEAGQGRAEEAPPAIRGPSILAHEIKNPLAAIRGAAQLIARKAAPRDRELADLVTAEVDRIAGLVDRMQTLGQTRRAALAPCNLHHAIRRAIAGVAAAGLDRIVVREEFDPSLPPVRADADGLVQVLVNLLANARDACMGAADPRIAVRTRFSSGLAHVPTRHGGSLKLPIEVRISDTGPGIDPGLRDHIFEPFVSSKGGQGLGLPLVAKLLRDMDGRVQHTRDEQAGWTHFTINLAVAAAGEMA